MNNNTPPTFHSMNDYSKDIDDLDNGSLIDDTLLEDHIPIIEEKKSSTKPEITGRKRHRIIFKTNPIPDKDKPSPNTDTVMLPSNFDKEIREQLGKMPNIEMLDDSKTREWADVVVESLDMNTKQEVFVEALEESEFTNEPTYNGINLTGQSSKFKSATNQILAGERAKVRLVSHLGLGSVHQVPLWSSGFWIAFKPPSESSLIELYRTIVSDKITFGRSSYGIVFSNTSSYQVNRLVDFALAHVYDTTALPDAIPLNQLKQHIATQDFPIVIWGLLCAMYPRGFRYKTACVANPEKCNHIVEDVLNVRDLQVSDTSTLTEWQLGHMSSRQSRTKDLESITRYRTELSRLQKKRIAFNEGSENEIFITLKSPTISEYIDAGYKWIGNIVKLVEDTAGLSDDKEKNAVIVNKGQATALRQYSHWVDSVEFASNVINDQETIDGVLDVISADDAIRSSFFKQVIQYINSTTLSIIGIPTYECPNCKEVKESPLENQYTNILPLDIIQLFSELLLQRVSRIAVR